MEKKSVVAVSVFLKNSKNQFLFLRRSKNNSTGVGCFQLPEGKIEWDEKPEETIKREVREETSGKVSNLRLEGVSSVTLKAKGNEYHVLRIIYSGKFSGKIKLSEDHTDFQWMTLKEALKQPLLNGVEGAIRQVL
ncbi:MAG: NUDIX hydrolase [archaeon]